MNGKLLLKAALISLVFALSLTGCGKDKENSREQVQYLSHMDQARFFQNQGELKASTQEAQSASKLNPSSVHPYLLMVDNLLIAGDASTAERELTQIEKHLSKNKGQLPVVQNRLAMDWARTELLRNNYDQALKHLDHFVPPKKDAAKDKAEFDTLRGRILLAKGDVDGAEKAYTQAQQAAPQSPQAKVGLSKVAYRKGDHKRAQNLLAQALKLDKDNSQTWLWKAQMAQQDKDYPTAESAYMKALDGIGKYDVMTYEKYTTMSSLIQVLRAEGKIQEAFVYEETLAKSAPGANKIDFEAAVKAYKKGNLEDAAHSLEQILKRAPGNQQSALLLGLIRFQQGKTQQAQALLEPLEANGNSMEASKLLAATQIEMGQSQQAQKMLEKLKGAEDDPGVLALVGIAAIKAGETDVGRTYIEKSLKLNPKNFTLRLRYANWLMQRKEYTQAASQARTAIEQKPDLAAARRMEIEAYLRGGDTNKANQAASEWRKGSPKNIAAIITSGDLALTENKPDEANRYYQQAARMAPKSARAQLALGTLNLKQGNQGKALAHYRKAVELAPNDQGALQKLMQASTLSKSELNKTMGFLHQQAKANPKAAGIRVLLLENALRLGHYKEADSLADDVQGLAKNQQSVDDFMAAVYRTAAVNKMRQDDPEQASKIIRLALKRFPKNLQVGLTHAQLLFEQKHESEALGVLRKLKRDFPDSEKPYLLEASYREGNKQYSQAKELYQLALEKSSNPKIYIDLAHAQSKAGQPDKAVATLEQASQKYPDAPDVVLQLALAYQAVKKTNEAESVYQRLLKIAPDQPVALNNLAWIYSQKGDKRAREMAKRAYQLQPGSAAIADTYGWIMFKQGNVKDSIPVLEKAHRLAPKEKDISLHLAQAYEADGQHDKSRAILKKF